MVIDEKFWQMKDSNCRNYRVDIPGHARHGRSSGLAWNDVTVHSAQTDAGNLIAGEYE
jgi:hypothetical protein